MENNNAIKEHYEKHYNEADRETDKPLEFIRTKIIISRYLTQKRMSIADVAGGTGAYSFWLANQGHQVHLLDLAQNHIDYAKERSGKIGVPLSSYICADARCLPYEDESMDIVLLMGALYHLQERADRIKCLLEAHRALKPKGVLICTAISRYSALIGYHKYGNINGDSIKMIDESINTGKYFNRPYFKAYFHKPDEIISEVSESGFNNVVPIAVEGFANMFAEDSFVNDGYKLSQILRHIELTENTPELLGVSRNIITVGIK